MTNEMYIKGLGWVDVEENEELNTFEKTKPVRTKAEIRERKEKRKKARKVKKEYRQ